MYVNATGQSVYVMWLSGWVLTHVAVTGQSVYVMWSGVNTC